MNITDHIAAARLTGALLLISLTSMIAGAAIVLPAGLTLNPSDPADALAAVSGNVALHLTELGLDVLGWLALTAAACALGAHQAMAGRHLAMLPAGLLAAAGLAGMLHDAGNLAVTQLAADPSNAASAGAVLLTAKWTVNLAGLLWIAATAATALLIPMSVRLRRTGQIAALCGLVGITLPWTTGTSGMTPTLEQLGYAFHLPVMIWYGVLGWRHLRMAPD